MTLVEAKSRHTELVGAVRKHDADYEQGHPAISDYDYDQLEREISDLEHEFSELVTPDSPTQRIRAEPLSKFERREHLMPMLSLEKIQADTHPTKEEEPDDRVRYQRQDRNTLEEFKRFDATIKKHLLRSPVDYVIEPKVDGVSISVHYRYGKLELGMTRGDGKQGDDITANIRKIRAIPLKLKSDSPPPLLEVRGEAFIPQKEFESLNAALSATGEEPFPNARNATAGTLKQLDSRLVARRPLSAVFYGIGASEGVRFETHTEVLETLEALGLPVQPYVRPCSGVEEVLERYMEEVVTHYDESRDLRTQVPYDIDGIVIKVNTLADWERIPAKTRAPGYAIVHKPIPWITPAETVLKGITVQVGRTGVLTPVAELQPVFVQGSTISRATLHNEDEIRRKDIRVGDTVVIRKAGMVIPEVVEVIKSKRPAETEQFDLFKLVGGKCPACGSAISKESVSSGKVDEVAWRCRNVAGCPAQITRRVEYFAQRSALDIESLGGIVAEKLVERGLVKEPLDLFEIGQDHLARLNLGTDEEPRVFGEKNAAKVREALERARKLPLSRWLLALAVPDLGEQTAYDVAKFHPDLSSVAKSTLLRDTVELHRLRDQALEKSPLASANKGKPKSERDAMRTIWKQLVVEADAVGQRVLKVGFAYLPEDKKNLRDVVTKVGPVTAQSTLAYFDSPTGLAVLERLSKLGIQPRADEVTKSANTKVEGVAGKTFVLTGTLPTLLRDDATKRIRDAGGSVVGIVSKNTDYLLAGENAGSKMDKARELGVRILTELEFLKMLGQDRGGDQNPQPDLFET